MAHAESSIHHMTKMLRISIVAALYKSSARPTLGAALRISWTRGYSTGTVHGMSHIKCTPQQVCIFGSGNFGKSL